MTDKELKRLRRPELLEMLLTQVEENRKMKIRLKEMKEQLENRQIMINKAGSIAEAALQLSGVFQAAEVAAAEYLENVRRFSGEEEAACQRIEAEAREKAEAICAEADAYSRKVRSQADQYQRQVVKKVQAMLKEQDALRLLLRSTGEEQNT